MATLTLSASTASTAAATGDYARLTKKCVIAIDSVAMNSAIRSTMAETESYLI